MSQPTEINLSAILADLDNGLTREEIAEKYGMKKMEMRRLFQDPALKGRKVRTKPRFVLNHDVEVPVKAKKTSPSNPQEGEASEVSEEQSTPDVASTTEAVPSAENAAAPTEGTSEGW